MFIISCSRSVSFSFLDCQGETMTMMGDWRWLMADGSPLPCRSPQYDKVHSYLLLVDTYLHGSIQSEKERWINWALDELSSSFPRRLACWRSNLDY